MYNPMGIKHLGSNVSFDTGPINGAPRRIRHLAQWIDPSWRSRSQEDRLLAADLAGVLDPYLANQRIQLTLSGGTLVIVCRDRASAMEIRFLQREIRKNLHATGHSGVEKVQVLFAQHQGALPAGGERLRVLPAEAAKALQRAAATIDDPGLAAALQRLARFGAKKLPEST